MARVISVAQNSPMFFFPPLYTYNNSKLLSKAYETHGLASAFVGLLFYCQPSSRKAAILQPRGTSLSSLGLPICLSLGIGHLLFPQPRQRDPGMPGLQVIAYLSPATSSDKPSTLTVPKAPHPVTLYIDLPSAYHRSGRVGLARLFLAYFSLTPSKRPFRPCSLQYLQRSIGWSSITIGQNNKRQKKTKDCDIWRSRGIKSIGFGLTLALPPCVLSIRG